MVQGFDQRFDVPGSSQDEAVQILKDWLSKVQTELSVEFPKMVPIQEVKEKPKAVEELRIDTLIGVLSKNLNPAATREDTIKEWLKMDYEPNNFPIIIDGLEKLKAAYETGKIKKGKA